MHDVVELEWKAAVVPWAVASPTYRISPLLSTVGIAAVAGSVAPMACRDDGGGAPPIEDVSDVVDVYQSLFDFYCECYSDLYGESEYCSGGYQPYGYSDEAVACLQRVYDQNPAAFEVLRCESEALQGYVSCLRAQGCPSTFDCGDGTAILEDFVCDGDADCANGSDESQGCPPAPMCANGDPIASSWICDGFDDCGDGSDEVDCPPPFMCNDGTVVSAQGICDGFSECPDGEDEDQSCPVTCDSRFAEQEEACGEVEDDFWMMTEECFDFACLSGLEIPRSQVCDGAMDCPDGEDEIECANPPPQEEG